jgi:GTP-binding protein Era
MDNVSRTSVADVDAAVLVVEPIPSPGEPERELMRRMEQLGVPSVLVINKIAKVEQKDKLLCVIEAYEKEHHFDQVMLLSAKEGDGVEQLFDLLAPYQVESPWFFPGDAITDQPERQIMGEILREKLLVCLDKEIPHGTAVSIEKFHERDDGVIDIEALIYCEKDSHKGIIIGKKGAMLKKISSLARSDMEAFLDAKVYLQTWVKVKENWRDNPGLIRSFGFTEE